MAPKGFKKVNGKWTPPKEAVLEEKNSAGGYKVLPISPNADIELILNNMLTQNYHLVAIDNRNYIFKRSE